MFIGLHVKNPLFFSDFKEIWIFSTYFRKIIKYTISWNSFTLQPRCSMRTDGQTDMTKLIAAFRNLRKHLKMSPRGHRTNSSRLPTGELYGKIHKTAGAGVIMANVFHETGRFPCDKNIFRPRNFPLSSANTDAASVNRNVSATSSGRPSFSSMPVKPFTTPSIFENQIRCQAWSYESND